MTTPGMAFDHSEWSGRFYVEALTFYRIGRALKRARVPILPRVCEGLIFLLFNSTIPLAAEIGRGSRCAHRGVAVILHPRARVGERCVIRAQVVIGGARPGDGPDDVPTIGNDVAIGVGAKLLGPIRIGDGAVIGANAVVLNDVPPGALAAGVPARVILPGTRAKLSLGAGLQRAH